MFLVEDKFEKTNLTNKKLKTKMKKTNITKKHTQKQRYKSPIGTPDLWKKWPIASRFHCLVGFDVVYGKEVGKIDFLRPEFIVL